MNLYLTTGNQRKELSVSRVCGWCEDVGRRTLEVLLPVLSVFLLALLEISSASVDEDADGEQAESESTTSQGKNGDERDEPHGVEVGERARETGTKTPGEGLDEVGRVVLIWFKISKSIIEGQGRVASRSTHGLDGELVPAGREELAAVRSLDVGRVVDSPPGKLREGFAGNVASSVLHSEDGLLRVGWKEGESSGVSKARGERQTRPPMEPTSVENPVREEEKRIDSDSRGERKAVRRGVGSRQVQDRVAVGERNSGKIPAHQERDRQRSRLAKMRWARSDSPEREHEAVLLVNHVDADGNALLAFGAGVDVETGGEDHEGHVLQRELVGKRGDRL